MLSDVDAMAQNLIKSVADERCFVQFLHPGGEHGLSHGDWNRGKHKRKFLQCMGRRFKQEKERLHFWGEWEAPSDVSRINQPAADGPLFVHAPYYIPPTTYCGQQNTDPFVFGSRFL